MQEIQTDITDKKVLVNGTPDPKNMPQADFDAFINALSGLLDEWLQNRPDG